MGRSVIIGGNGKDSDRATVADSDGAEVITLFNRDNLDGRARDEILEESEDIMVSI